MMTSEVGSGSVSDTDKILSSGKYSKIRIIDGVKYLVPPENILSGGPPKDGIPSIDNPKFLKTSEVDFLDDAELVLGFEYEGEFKAYPLQILVWHEIVNDTIGNLAVAVTYCPLCGTGIAYERALPGAGKGEVVEFGVSGKLFNSDLVMYDRKTETYWDQIEGQGIVGELTGETLHRLPLVTVRYGDWKEKHPETLVLSRETGINRNYGTSPYGDYDTNTDIFFPISNKDDRLHPKDPILGITSGESFKAYPEKELEKVTLVNDTVGGEDLLLVRDPKGGGLHAFKRQVDGQTLIFKVTGEQMQDKETGTTWSFDGKATKGKLRGQELESFEGAVRSFWFAWATFKPDTDLFTQTEK